MDYDLVYFDLETRVLDPRQAFRAEVVTHVAGTLCNLCLRVGP
jgi:hypothetical protein